MENPGVSGEYGLFGVLIVLFIVGGIVSLLVYAGLKLGLKNPEDIP
jgi:hypothetical protein